MVPLYIMGLLLRFGPQHGYRIKKIISEQLADFTQIKLPTIYYHLEKLETQGLLEAEREKPGARPEKTVYKITPAGEQAFESMLKELTNAIYKPIFPTDAMFYFGEHLQNGEIAAFLRSEIRKLEAAMAIIRTHCDETLAYVPEDARPMVRAIFSHHEKHYLAELDWAKETLEQMEGVRICKNNG